MQQWVENLGFDPSLGTGVFSGSIGGGGTGSSVGRVSIGGMGKVDDNS